MKRIVNILLTTVLTAGCSENEGIDSVSQVLVGKKQEMASGVSAKASNNAVLLCGTLSRSGAEGWMADDSISIYRLESMLHNTYKLTDGAGTAAATFTRSRGSDNYEQVGKLYALTNCRYLYGVSAAEGNEAKVAVSIPYCLNLSDVGAPVGCSRMVVPYWGMASFGADGRLTAEFRGLTALLKIDAATLPAGTRAVVLSTHYYGELGNDELAEGDGESLSGMFDAVLTEGARLQPNEIFVSRDTLRINLGSKPVPEQYRYLYIPVIATTYTKLHVIAVTGDYRYPYTWDGRLLKTFNAATFKTNTITDVEWIDTGINLPRI